MDIDVKLAELTDWADSVRDTQAILTDNTLGRDLRMREAAKAGIGPSAIGQATGLTRSRVNAIIGKKASRT
ncbi:hypothetical protein [Subtercola vilae]|uniref:hypothetical protein n=1 Tax=Subtercola vilae TaxID=2056433 RepID=UPI0010AA7667|nr:hypothetical protein [Subtercola vilae]